MARAGSLVRDGVEYAVGVPTSDMVGERRICRGQSGGRILRVRRNIRGRNGIIGGTGTKETSSISDIN